MKVLKKEEFLKTPIGTVWSEADAFEWHIKTDMKLGAHKLFDVDDLKSEGVWDCAYDADYDEDSEFWVAEIEEVEIIVSQLNSALSLLKKNV